MPKVVVITGASAGVGRAAAVEFARCGRDVALIARDQQRLDEAASEVRRIGQRAFPVVADVADYSALQAAAAKILQDFGSFDIWVNNAMATIFAPVHRIDAAEFRRATEVTYLGTVHGTMIALAHMRERNRGTIVNVGSALAYRSIPLQSAYCGAKFAIRGFTDSLRSELLHDGVNVRVTMVQLPAVNTPQFDWALNKTSQRPQPVPPIFQPEVAAQAIVFAAFDRRREIWLGVSTVKAILANFIAPGLLDRVLARAGYSGQLTKESKPENAPTNLYKTVPGPYGAHGRFDVMSKETCWELSASRHRDALIGCVVVLAGATLVSWLGRRRRTA